MAQLAKSFRNEKIEMKMHKNRIESLSNCYSFSLIYNVRCLVKEVVKGVAVHISEKCHSASLN